MVTRVPLPSPYEHRTAFWIPGVYSDEECLGLIKMAEDGEGFGRATVTTGADGEQTLMEEYRKSGRRIIVDSALADQIFQLAHGCHDSRLASLSRLERSPFGHP